MIAGKIGSYGIYIREQLYISTDDIGDMYLIEKFVNKHFTNQTPGSSSNPPINPLEKYSSQSDETGIHAKSYCADTLYIFKKKDTKHNMKIITPSFHLIPMTQTDDERININTCGTYWDHSESIDHGRPMSV